MFGNFIPGEMLHFILNVCVPPNFFRLPGTTGSRLIRVATTKYTFEDRVIYVQIYVCKCSTYLCKYVRIYVRIYVCKCSTYFFLTIWSKFVSTGGKKNMFFFLCLMSFTFCLPLLSAVTFSSRLV